MIKGIIFDKDGTLIEFNHLWNESSKELISLLVTKYGKTQVALKRAELEHRLGLERGVITEHSVIASHATQDIALIIADYLEVDYELILKETNTFYYSYVKANQHKIKEIGNLKQLFKHLKAADLKIAIVTADNLDITKLTLSVLGINDCIDFLATADTFKRKPDKESITAFCQLYNLSPDELIHVGDTDIDMMYAENVKFGVGVLTGVGSRDTLAIYTPYILESVDDLVNQQGGFIYHV